MLTALCLLVLTTLGPGDAFRLPRDVIPTEYQLKVITDLGSNGNFTFRGEVWIHVDCRNLTSNITLHSKELKIQESKITVTPKDGTTNLLSSMIYEPRFDFLILELSKPLQQGHKYIIHIPFQGNLTKGLAGYYRSSYVDSATNETRWLAVTQFESTDARRGFPCFDEPEFKAQFTVSLGHHKKFGAVSNMPLNYSEPMKELADWQWDHFLPTEHMSTYLLAYMVSDLEHRMSPPISNVTFRIWARHDALPQTEYAGNVGPRVLNFYENFFGINFPLPKQDMAAIPDFSAGAMENWGFITYRETALLYDPNVTSAVSKMYLTSTIAHELAHQWFGNLVTMKWWSDLWLNEGFATYVATLGVNEIYPEWKILQSDAVSGFLTVTKLDALKSSHPVFIPIDKLSKVSQIFDPISYKKGAYLLRMMDMFLGREVFRKGVSQYLKKHKFSNAEQDDLWQCLTEVGHEQKALPEDLTIKMVMDTWTVQTGFPVLTITRDYETGTATIMQKRYLSFMNEKSEPCWIVPLTYTIQSELDFETTSPAIWLTCNSTVTEISGLPQDDQWLIFNKQIEGLYRVNYDEKNWQLISHTLNTKNFTSIHVLNRVQLVDDVMKLAWVGSLPYSTTLSIVNYLQHETEFLPWQAALNNLGHLNKLLRRTMSYGYYRGYLRKLLTPIYQKTGNITQVPNADLMKVRLHSLVVTWACKLEMGNCVEQANSLFKSWMKTKNPDANNPIPRDVRAVVYCSAIKHGGEKEWNFVWQRYLKSNVGTEKNTLMSSLSCSRDPWLLERYLQWSLNETSGIRRQDSYNVFTSVAGSEAGFNIAKRFLYNEMPRLHKYYGPKSSRLSRYLSALSTQMFTSDEHQELDQFLRENEEYLKHSSLSANQALETVQSNNQWHVNYFSVLLDSVIDHQK